MTKTRIRYHTFLGRLQRFYYTRKGATSVISRAKWDWKPGEAESAMGALDQSMLDRFEDSVTQVVRRSIVYNRALVDKFGDHDAVRGERTSFKVAVTHFEECMRDLGPEDRDKAEKRFETMSIWMKENGIEEA